MKSRVTALKNMNNKILTDVNDEEIIMTWLALGVPDCPYEDDFESIAEDDIMYEEVCKLFERLIKLSNYK